ncbi:MAG: hypothetical protein NVSMB58_37050 [Terriglobales bacterium]
MKCNVGGMEKSARFILAVVFALVAWFLVASVILKVVFGILAAIMLLTALVRFCPLNAMFGRNSCEVSGR